MSNIILKQRIVLSENVGINDWMFIDGGKRLFVVTGDPHLKLLVKKEDGKLNENHVFKVNYRHESN
jgi:hypothetical protein